VPAGWLRVTRCFGGWLPAAAIAAGGQVCQAVAGSPVPGLELGGALWLPAPQPPARMSRRTRVLAVGLRDRDGALGNVQRKLSRALTAGGWYEPEVRSFLSHVTVARVRQGASGPLPALPVTARFVGPADLATIPLRRAPKVAENIRIVEIGGFDWSACGGTHVATSAEVGLIKVRKVDRRGNGKISLARARRSKPENELIFVHCSDVKALPRRTCFDTTLARTERGILLPKIGILFGKLGRGESDSCLHRRQINLLAPLEPVVELRQGQPRHPRR